eukprot:374598_1
MATFSILLLLTTLQTVFANLIYTQSFKTFYVSKTGQDGNDCGDTPTSACGTLYWTSLLINGFVSTYEGNYTIDMNIMDGQNENEIMKLSTNNNYTNSSDPCLPVTFIGTRSENNEMIITFDPSITTMNEWYPIDTCINNNIYTNEYIFVHKNASFTIEFLIIDEAIQPRSYGFILYFDSNTLWCYNCKFNNLWFNPLMNNKSLFNNMNKTYFYDTQFTNMTFNTLIVGDTQYELDAYDTVFVNLNMNSFATLQNAHSGSYINIYFAWSVAFTNVTVKESLFQMVRWFSIGGTSFVNVNIGGSLVDSISEYSSIYMSNCFFSNIST